ncbi:hypothetical protein [Agromyces humatus]|uniref:Uncharacterized protein n=1 Tax=Agromyces humatus TaxID=279573 RepID=A0ABN2KBA8_9MICO|nr:hypothetical protein [Agromyces humatus]
MTLSDEEETDAEDQPGPSAARTFLDVQSGELGLMLGVKNSLESRGTAVIWTSSSVVTLLLGVLTLNWNLDRTEAALRGWTFMFFVVGLIAFFGALVAGLVVNWPHRYRWWNFKSPKGIIRYLGEENIENRRELVDSPGSFIEGNLIEHLVGQMKRAHRSNKVKSIALSIGIGAESLAFIALVSAVVLTFIVPA